MKLQEKQESYNYILRETIALVNILNELLKL